MQGDYPTSHHGTLSRNPAPYPPYYYTERNTYVSSPGTIQYDKGGGGVIVEKYVRKIDM